MGGIIISLIYSTKVGYYFLYGQCLSLKGMTIVTFISFIYLKSTLPNSDAQKSLEPPLKQIQLYFHIKCHLRPRTVIMTYTNSVPRRDWCSQSRDLEHQILFFFLSIIFEIF